MIAAILRKRKKNGRKEKITAYPLKTQTSLTVELSLVPLPLSSNQERKGLPPAGEKKKNRPGGAVDKKGGGGVPVRTGGQK